MRLAAEHLVAGLELGDSRTNRLDHARELHAEDPVARPKQAGDEARDRELGAAEADVCPVDGRGDDPNENLVVARTGGSTSSSRRTSGGPYRSWMTALIG